MEKKASGNRLEWIDITKAITIILMIAGHTVAYGTETRNLIFSFHMPLFYILTGYTIRGCKSWKEIAYATAKDFRKIYMPVIYTSTVLIFLRTILFRDSLDNTIWILLKSIFWGFAVGNNGHPALGALWFLVVLFWSKLLYRIITHLFTEENAGIVFLFCMILTYFISKRVWLPQSLDLVPLVSFFIFTGKFLARSKAIFSKNKTTVILLSFVFWICAWMSGIYIEVGTRSFPYFIISIIEAIAGSICMMRLGIAISLMPARTCIAPVKKSLLWIGSNTLLVLCVHHLDWYVLRYIRLYNPDGNMILAIFIRVSVVFFITIVLSLLWKCLKRLLRIGKK